jgi:hypothetical protein
MISFISIYWVIYFETGNNPLDNNSITAIKSSLVAFLLLRSVVSFA